MKKVARRLALPLLLLLVALGAVLLFLDGGQQAEPERAADEARDDAPGAAEAATGAGGAGEAATERTTVEDDAAAFAAGAGAVRLGIPGFVGRVLDRDGAPVAGAEVRATGLAGWGAARDREDFAARLGADWTLHSRADGRFAVPEAPRDGLRFELLITDPRHAPFRLLNLPAWPGRTRDLGDLVLARGFAAAGRVSSAEGAPVAGALVYAYPDLTATAPGADLGQVEPLPLPPAITDREGAFRLERLGPARVRLRAATELGFSPWSDGIGAEEGGEVADIGLSLLPGVLLEGVVLTPERLPIAGARVTADARTSLPDPNDRFRLETQSGADGGFRLAVPAALRSVRLRAGGEGTWLAERALERPEQWSRPIELILKPMPLLAGTVTVEPGAPAAGAEVALTSRWDNGRAPDPADVLARAVVDERGEFTLAVDLTRATGTSFRVVAWDGVHLPAASEPLRLRGDGRGFQQPKLALTLTEGLALAGRALAPAGEPVAGARAMLRRLTAPRTGRVQGLEETARGGPLIAVVTTGADGGFRFTGLPAWDYRVELHHRDWSPADSPDLPLTESLEALEIRMNEACGILGAVEGDLAAVPSLQVTLRAPGREPLVTPVDGRGTFEFAGIAPDVYSLELHPAPMAAAESLFSFAAGRALGRLDQLVVEPGEQVRATLPMELSEFGVVAGEIRDSGAPAANHRVILLRAETTTDPDPRISARNSARAARSTQTDHLGRYRIAGVESGDYLLVVTGPGKWPSGMWNESGARDPRGLARRHLRVDAGGETRCDFLVRLGRLRIEVENAAAEVIGQQVELVPLPTSDDGEAVRVYVGRRGAVTAPMASGPYELRYGEGEDLRAWQVFVPAEAEGAANITLPVKPRRNG